MQDWPETNSWIENPKTLLSDLGKLSDLFDEAMMRGASTLPACDMEQVEVKWADFAGTARRFSQRLRAAQTLVGFPVDANAIIRVADTVDELNYGPQRWQISTTAPDRELTTMKFKERYFEHYVHCQHIFVDAVSTLREYLSLSEVMNAVKRSEGMEPRGTENSADDAGTQKDMGGRTGFKVGDMQGACASEDFRSVNWFGTTYSFTTYQSKMVELLWKAWMKGTPEVTDTVLLDEYGGDGRRVRDVFKEAGNKTHKAFGKMIKRGRKDTYLLVEPERPAIPT